MPDESHTPSTTVTANRRMVIACVDCGCDVECQRKTRELCTSCRKKRSSKAAAEIVRAKRRAAGQVPRGTVIERSAPCHGCGAPMAWASKTPRSPRKFCLPCKMARHNELVRIRQTGQRRARGVSPNGDPVTCIKCSARFVKKSGNQKVCGQCQEAHYVAGIEAWRQANKPRLNARGRERIKTDPVFALNKRMRTLVRRSLVDGKGGRSWESLVGYTADDLKRHIERLFLNGMSWANLSDWHIDHRRPVSGFKITGPDCQAFRDCWALTNLQPLWSRDNLVKGDASLYLL